MALRARRSPGRPATSSSWRGSVAPGRSWVSSGRSKLRSGINAVHARIATPADAAAITRIYNQGIEDRVATFETRPRSFEDVHAWFDGTHPIVVVEDGDRIVAFAS